LRCALKTSALVSQLLVGDVHVPFAEMILGLDFWRSRRLWLDSANQVAYVQTGNAPP
jgi:hypothetical protein